MNMNKAWNKLKKFSFSLFVTCFILFNSACGLDTFVVMKDPVNTVDHTPNTDTIMFEEKYFSFLINGSGSYPADFMYLGVDIYYKIYNNFDVFDREVSYLDSLSLDTENNSKSSDKLRYEVSSGGYGYLPLKIKGYTESPLIPASTNPKNIYIRLTDYQSSHDYSARVEVEGEELGVPIRNIEDYTFNFGRNGEKDKIPTSDQKDVNYSNSTSDNTWYVALFAVGVGRDVTYTPYYSNIMYLGAVPIYDNAYDN